MSPGLVGLGDEAGGSCLSGCGGVNPSGVAVAAVSDKLLSYEECRRICEEHPLVKAYIEAMVRWHLDNFDTKGIGVQLRDKGKDDQCTP